jgi:hypothetical protein
MLLRETLGSKVDIHLRKIGYALSVKCITIISKPWMLLLSISSKGQSDLFPRPLNRDMRILILPQTATAFKNRKSVNIIYKALGLLDGERSIRLSNDV